MCRVTATGALDMWSFGVIALELLTTERDSLSLHRCPDKAALAAGATSPHYTAALKQFCSACACIAAATTTQL